MILAKLTPGQPSCFSFLPRLLCALALLLALVATTHEAFAKPKVHVVYAGQRLGSIAKRYNVSVEELCEANGITSKSPIHPGQKLIIPGTDDGTKDTAKAGKDSKAKDQASSSKKEAGPSAKPKAKARVHVVAKGHTLSAIAGRYAITVGALCHANDLARDATLSVGDRLVVPDKSDKDGSLARKQRAQLLEPETPVEDKATAAEYRAESAKKSGPKSWEPYLKPAWKRSFIKMRRYGRYWEGYVLGPKGEVLGHASNKINFVLGAKSDGPRIDSKLIRLIASVSDKFGGRELRIVSGYRTKSFVAASQHKQGRALDFSIPGVPNEALRDYLRTLDDIGVGYYPNSSFVHVDVRGYSSYWIDYAGPGEAPRKASKKKNAAQKKNKQDEVVAEEHEHEHGDDEHEQGDDEHEHGDDERGDDAAPPIDEPNDDAAPPNDKGGAPSEEGAPKKSTPKSQPKSTGDTEHPDDAEHAED